MKLQTNWPRLAVAPEKANVAPGWLRTRFESVVLGPLRQTQQTLRSSSEWTTSRRLKEIDSAFSGKHVKVLLHLLTRLAADVLSQLRTGHSELPGFLVRIQVEETDQCECGQGVEDTRHFLLHCARYEHLRDDMVRKGGKRYGDLSYMLGGGSSYQDVHGSSPDGPIEKWKPNLPVVRAVIKVAIEIGRLSSQSPSSIITQNSRLWGFI